MNARILLADDHRMFREGLKQLLESRRGMTVIGEAEDGRAAVRLARELDPDVVVMDLGMPVLNGVEAIRQIRARNATVPILALSMHCSRAYVTRALGAGANGYLLKSSAFEEVATAIAAIRAGEVYLSPDLTKVVVESFVQLAASAGTSSTSPLTPREREVLQLVAEGRSTRQIAETLGVSVKTVETHRKQIMDKLEIRSVAELTKYALREGITVLES